MQVALWMKLLFCSAIAFSQPTYFVVTSRWKYFLGKTCNTFSRMILLYLQREEITCGTRNIMAWAWSRLVGVLNVACEYVVVVQCCQSSANPVDKWHMVTTSRSPGKEKEEKCTYTHIPVSRSRLTSSGWLELRRGDKQKKTVLWVPTHVASITGCIYQENLNPVETTFYEYI